MLKAFDYTQSSHISEFFSGKTYYLLYVQEVVTHFI